MRLSLASVLLWAVSGLCGGCGGDELSPQGVDCEQANGGCEQECVMTDGRGSCACSEGYELGPNGAQCMDVDECMDASVCPQGECVNEEGSYRCECETPFSEDCEDCLVGYYGPSCSPCPQECVQGCDDGVDGDGRCVCAPGLVGPACDRVDPEAPPERLRVQVPKGDELRTLVLDRYSVRAWGALRVKVVTPDGEVSDFEPDAAIRTYRGYCEEEYDASVSAQLLPSGAMRYHVFKGDPHQDWGFTPEEEYGEFQAGQTPEIRYTVLLGTAAERSGQAYEGASFTASNAMGDSFLRDSYRSHMALIVSYDYLNDRGYTDLDTVIRKAENSIARTNAIYIRDVLTELNISEILIRQDVMTNWEQGRQDLLGYFPDANPNSVFTVTDEYGSGLAYVCMNGGDPSDPVTNLYAASKVGPGDDGTWYGVMRHEYGHIQGSDHYEGGSPEGPTLMSGNSLSRLSAYEAEAIFACRQTPQGDAARFTEPLGTYEDYPVPPYARLDDFLSYDSDVGTLTIDVLGNDWDVNADRIAIADFPATTPLGARLTLSAASGPSGRDVLRYESPSVAPEGVVLGSCGASTRLSAEDCVSCVPKIPDSALSCTQSQDCGPEQVCVGGRCRAGAGCEAGELVNACGHPCPGSGLALWFDASDLDALEDFEGRRGQSLAHGGTLQRLFDLSGNGHDAEVYVDGYAPVLEKAYDYVLNGRPSVHFAQSFMEVRDLDVRAATHPAVTSFAVVQHLDGDVVWVQQQNGFNKREHKALGDGRGDIELSVMAVSEEGGIEHWLNGVPVDAVPTELEAAETGIGLGALLYAGTGYEGAYHAEMLLGELLIFTRALSEEERNSIVSYLLAKWGIPLQDRFWVGIVDETGLGSRAPVHVDLD